MTPVEHGRTCPCDQCKGQREADATGIAVVGEQKRPKRERPKSRSARWADACGAAREALNDLGAAKEAFEEAMSELNSIREEFEEWHQNLDGKFEGSALVEKLEAVSGLTTEVEIDLSEAESAVDEAEGADLPLGFGRD